jgi:isoleucyl-tRNA synthetase
LPFRQQALQQIDQVQWIPEWGVNRIRGAVDSRPDWCISRQRTWGVPIPAFYDDQGEPILSADIVRKAADLFEQHGSNIWFEKSASELWTLCRPSGWSGPEAVAKSTDTLDVWIDSGSSSRAVLMRRPELQHPASAKDPSRLPWQADVYLEGTDQHRGWFQSSLLLSLGGNQAPPFKTVLTHGFMVDEDREKISKSKQGQGGYAKPQTAERYIREYGADVVRLWVASQDYRSDIIVSEERLKKVGETYRLLRNTFRYQLSNLHDFDPNQHAVVEADWSGLDRWIRAAFAELEKEVANAYEAFEFHLVYQKITQFAAVELSSVYHDLIKDRLYCDPANSTRRRSAQTTLYHLISRLAQMLAPIFSFTTDEAWEHIPGVQPESVHLSVWQPSVLDQSDEEKADWEQLLSIRSRALPVLEQARQARKIGKALEAHLLINLPPEEAGIALRHKQDLLDLLNVSQLTLSEVTSEVGFSASVMQPDGKKCGRCWRWEVEVGMHTEHPELCPRCVTAVTYVNTPA